MPTADDTRLIPLSQGKFATVDAADYEWLNQWSWTAQRGKHTFYAKRNYWDSSAKKHKVIYMHRLISGVEKGKDTDHRDGDGLNNCRSNLRSATRSQNTSNSQPVYAASGFRGVYEHPTTHRFRATLTKQGKFIDLGYFATAERAARARDAASKQHFGEFAVFNLPR